MVRALGNGPVTDTVTRFVEAIREETPGVWEDANFQTVDSPVVCDMRAALGRNATEIMIINDGPGNFTLEFSEDGIAWSDPLTVQDESLEFDKLSINSVRLTWVSDSAYRVIAL